MGAHRGDELPLAIVGAGIVGCATAYMLSKAGHRVLLIDRASELASGASRANGAQLSYSFVEPLATPSVLRKLPSILAGRDSALRVRLQVSLSQLIWGVAFLAACRQRQVDDVTRKLIETAERSRVEIQQLLALGADFKHKKCGKLVLLNDVDAMRRAQATVELQKRFGADQTLLSRDSCVAMEPALADTASGFVGAIWSESDALCDAPSLCRWLVDRAKRDKLELMLGRDVVALSTRNGMVERVVTDNGQIEVSKVVLAGGTDAVRLARTCGIRLPIQSIKGYSITLRSQHIRSMPSRSITDLAKKIVYAPLGDSLRVAGFAELSCEDTRIDNERIHQLIEATNQRFGITCASDTDVRAWAGLRPATPTSLPIVGRTKVPNLYMNVGHGALGLTLALGSARQLEEMI